MKVLLCVIQMSRSNGGVNTHIIDLCSEMLKKGIEVLLVTNDNLNDYKDIILEFSNNDKFTFKSVNMEGINSQPMKLFKVICEFYKIAKYEKIDIIHTHSQSLIVVAQFIKWLLNIPFVWTNHIDAIASPKLFKYILKLKFPIISVSSELKKLMIEEYKVNEKRIHLVFNGINLDLYSSLSKVEKENLINQWNCNDKFIISLLARMTYGKGHMYLLEAVNNIQKKYNITNIKVLVAGKVYEESYLDSLLEFCKNNSIDMSYLGFQSPRNVFGISNLSTLPSIYEGFGLTALESIIMGCPVIRSNTPGANEMKDFTLVFDKGNVEQFTKCILHAYNHPNEMNIMVENGIDMIKKIYNINYQANETINVYNNILELNGKRGV